MYGSRKISKVTQNLPKTASSSERPLVLAPQRRLASKLMLILNGFKNWKDKMRIHFKNKRGRMHSWSGGAYPTFSRSTPPPPFLRLPLSRNPRCPTFYMPIRKTNVLKDSFNRFVYNFYPQSILILEEYLRKW